MIETFGSRLNSLVLVDTVTGSQREFLSSPHRSVSNPRISPDDLRSGARARRIGAASGRPEGDAFDAIAFKEMFVPTMMPGTAPFIASDDVICVLADLRGDIWVMSV